MTTSSTAAASTGRGVEIRALTGLRIVAAVWVMVYHLAWPMAGPYGQYLQAVWPIVKAGWVGVDLFFVLSGFVITWNYVDKLGERFRPVAAADYLWARFCRVWPVWGFLTVLFAAFLRFTRADAGTTMDRPVTVGRVTEQLLMVQMWHRQYKGSATYILSGWSLSAEWLAYLCFPLLVLVLWRLRRLPAGLLALGGVAVMVPSTVLEYRGQEPLWYLRIAAGFVAGALIAMAVRKIDRTAGVQRLAAVIALGCCAEIAVICWWAGWRDQDMHSTVDFTGVCVIVFPVLVGALVLTDRGPSRFLSRHAMVVGGRISFCLYLVHLIVFEIFDLVARRTPGLSPLTAKYVLIMPQLLLVALALAWLLHTYVEEPARLWLRTRGPSLWLSAVRARGAATVAAAGARDEAVPGLGIPGPRWAPPELARPPLERLPSHRVPGAALVDGVIDPHESVRASS